MNELRTNLCRLLCCLGFALAMVTSGSAFAQSDTERAKAHFEAGAAHYYEGEFAKALVEFNRGHALVPNPLFVYNISLCHLRLGQYRKALDKAISAQKSGKLPEKEEIRNTARIPSIGVVLSARELAEKVEPSRSLAVEDTSDAGDASASEGSFGGLGYTGIVFVGLGAGALVGAFIFDASIASLWEDYQEVQGLNTRAARDIQNQIESEQTIARILVFTGAGAAALGLGMIVFDLLDDGSETSVAIVPTHDGANATLNFQF